MSQKFADKNDAKKFRKEVQKYLLKKLEECTEFEKQIQDEMVKRYGIWMTMEEAAEAINRSRSTMYRYKDEDLIIYKQNGRLISVYTRSLILVL